MKIKINIPGFGERYCSDNCYFYFGDFQYLFYKKETDIVHNEYGPAIECKNDQYQYSINNKPHRLRGYAYNFMDHQGYFIIGEYIGNTKKEFIKNLANILIPKQR